MSHRFRFIGEARGDGGWRLGEDETQHLAKVLRLGVGDEIEVTDGQGAWAVGVVEGVTKRETLVRGVSEGREERPRFPVVVCVGALRPGLVDEILPGLVELGVDQVRVFQQPGSAKARTGERAVERWERVVRQAVKQCKRAWLPGVRVMDGVGELVAELEGELGAGAVRLVMAPEALVSLWEALEGVPSAATGLVLLAGGEKGLEVGEERVLAEAGFRPARLGRHVLRAVTAVAAGAALTCAHRDRLGSEPVLR